ncbi:MAG: HAAS signaling domain-containing protein [Candidatus Acidiferrales bacterium]
MTTHEKARDLIERYLHKIGEELPAKQRDDVKNELRSLLEDTLEERASTGRSVDEQLAIEVLREFGKPEAVAERYRPTGRYLIGPRLFPVYVGVGKIVLIVLAGIYVLSVGLATAVTPAPMPELFRPGSIWGLVESFGKLAIVNLALLTIVFALIERFADTRSESPQAEWDPRALPAVPVKEDHERISPPNLVFKIYAILALFAWVNFFPETFGFWFIADDSAHTILFSEMGLRLPVILINVWWGLALALNMWLLRLGRWTRESRWAELGLGIFGAILLYITLAGSAIIGTSGSTLADPWKVFSPLLWIGLRDNMTGFGKALHVILTIILFVTLVEALVRLYRILRRYPVW